MVERLSRIRHSASHINVGSFHRLPSVARFFSDEMEVFNRRAEKDGIEDF